MLLFIREKLPIVECGFNVLHGAKIFLLIRYGAENAMVPKMMGHEDEKSSAEYF